jgi:hypothetical protein
VLLALQGATVVSDLAASPVAKVPPRKQAELAQRVGALCADVLGHR